MIKHLTLAVALLFGSFVLHAAELVNINTANAEAIAKSVSGIGMVKADAIVKYREKNGPYKSVDDLSKVNGIGDGTIKKIRSQVTVSSLDKTKK